MKHSTPFLATLAIMVTAAPGATAQATNPQRATTQPRIVQSFGFVPAAAIVPPIANAPFTAVLIERSEDALSDGVNINREIQEVVMRDGAGRIYRARTVNLHRPELGARATPASSVIPRMVITITDPVARTQYSCTPIKICRKVAYRQWSRGRGPQPGPYPVLDRLSDRSVTVEDLGTANISGVEVSGKRLTKVILEGTVGNDRPFATAEEIWHSKELDVDIQVKRTDPRFGTRTAAMTEVNPGEPGPSYFQVPVGYRVESAPRRTPPQPQVEPFAQQSP